MSVLPLFLQIFFRPRSLRDQFLRNLIGLLVLLGVVFGIGFMLESRAESVLVLRAESLEKKLEAELAFAIRERFGASLPSAEAVQQLIPNVNENVPYLQMLHAAGKDAFPDGIQLTVNTEASQELGNGIREVPFVLSARGDPGASVRLLKNLEELPILVAITSYSTIVQTGEGDQAGLSAISVNGFVYLRVSATR